MIDPAKVQRWREFEQNKRGEWGEGQMVVAASDYDALAAENAEMKNLLWGARQSEVVTRTMRAVWGLKYTQEIDALLGEEK